jgi:membrane protein DedA with SNARE-associated domain
MEDILTSLSTYGYIILFVYSFGGGMIGLIGASILSSPMFNEMNIFLSIAIAGTSNMLGDLFLFHIGRTNKQNINKIIPAKYNSKKVISKILLQKYADFIIIIQKYLYGIKTLIPILIGSMANYSFVKFAIINFFATLIWSLSIGLSVYYFGAFFKNIISADSIPWYAPVILFLGILTLSWLFITMIEVSINKKREKRKKSDIEE